MGGLRYRPLLHRQVVFCFACSERQEAGQSGYCTVCNGGSTCLGLDRTGCIVGLPILWYPTDRGTGRIYIEIHLRPPSAPSICSTQQLLQPLRMQARAGGYASSAVTAFDLLSCKQLVWRVVASFTFHDGIHSPLDPL
jgi:hypothetical protein